jgi:ribosome recycling factor
MDVSDLKGLHAEVRRRMDGAIDHLRRELSGLRSGRASTSLLDPVQVEAYGTTMPLNQVASLSVPEPTMIVAQPFDAMLVGAIDRAIQKANLGLNPVVDGKILRIPIPPLTEERRKDMSRLVHKYSEDGRNSVRQVRRDANDKLKKMLKEHQISEDDERRALEEVQKITDNHIAQIDTMQSKKDEELLGK